MRDGEQFKAILQLLVPLVIEEIVKIRKVPEHEALVAFYSSSVYERLENEKTKLWHLSPLCLANLLQEELDTGKATFPREA